MYLSWIYELGQIKISKKKLINHLEIRQDLSYWWMSLLSEGNYAKSPNITTIIKIFALDEWSNRNRVKKIYLYTSNVMLINIIKIWSKNKKIILDIKLKSNSDKKKNILRLIYNKLPHTFQAIYWLVKFLVRNWKLRGVGNKKWKNSNGKITFVSYLFNVPPEAIKKNFFL